MGILNTSVGYGTMFLLYNLVHGSYWLSSAANHAVGGIVCFFLNKYFTFQNRERSWKLVGKFFAAIAVCYLLAYGLSEPFVMWTLSGQAVKVQESAAMLVEMCLYTGLNYLGQRFFVFRAEK